MNITFSVDEVRMLAAGKFTMFSCPSCLGKGWYWVDEMGTKRELSANEDESDFCKHPCDFNEEDCGGVGFRLVFGDEE